MNSRLLRSQPLLATLAALGAAAPAAARQVDLATVPGQVNDLAVDAAGRLLYCTAAGEVGRVDLAGTVTQLADTSSGLPGDLRALVEKPSGDIAVAQQGGDIWILPGGGGSPFREYSDLYLINGVTDLIVDASGNFLLCSKTPSSNTYGINWVNSSGSRWAYFLVEEAPYTLAVDPLTNDLFMADRAGSGALRMIDVHDETRPLSDVDTTTSFGFQPAALDGDMAADVAGNVYVAAGGQVLRHDRGAGTTATWAGGFAQLHGLVIAASSGNVPSASGWSVYLAEGGGPTHIVELGDAGAPAGTVASGLGGVPNRGRMATLFAGTGLRVYELATDNDGNLLAGGDQFGGNQQVRRIETTNFTWSVVAGPAEGIAGRVEGITVEPDGTIHTLSTGGYLQEIKENPTTVTTLSTDPLDQVTAGKDMISDRDGTFFLADREGFGPGEVLSFFAGTATTLERTGDVRGLLADPFNAGMLVTAWNGTGFCGTVSRYDFTSGQLALLPGFARLNYTNDWVWGDGDTAMDVEGNIYTCSEDDWRVTRYDPAKQRFSIIGSSYLNHPSGVAIAPSSPAAASASGWSLYVSEFDFLWEIADVPPPAPRLLDRNAPPAGKTLGWFPRSVGRPLAMVADPAGDGLYLTTEGGRLLHLQVSTGTPQTVFMPPGVGQLSGLTALSDGDLVVASATGLIFRLDAQAGLFPTLLWANSGAELAEVRGLAADGQDRLLIVDRVPGLAVSRVQRLSAGALTLLTNTAEGLRPAVDPLTGDVFVTERGRPSDGLGEVLRIDAFATPPTHGHWRGAGGFQGFDHGPTDGGIAFAASGDFYVVEGDLGRVARVERATGLRTYVAGNYQAPRAIALAPGTPGIAGPQGTSLFVVDGWAVHEVGVAGLPAGLPPATNPGLAPPAEFQVTGDIALNTLSQLTIRSPSEAGRIYMIVPSLAGKLPGFPLSLFGTPDPRVLPSNPDMLWNLIGNPVFMPLSIGVLDGAGTSPAGAAVFIGPSPTVYNLKQFLDLVWVSVDVTAPNRIARVGATAQLYLGN